MKYILFVLFFMMSAPCFSQTIKMAGINYAYYPQSVIKNNPNPDEKVDYQEFSAFVRIPTLFKNQQDILLHMIRYELVHSVVYNPTGNTADKIAGDYHSIIYNLSWIHHFNNKWLMLLSVAPTIASDFEAKFSHEDIGIQSAGLAKYNVTDKFNVGAGITYFRGLGRPLVIPLLQLNYHSERFNTAVLLPVNADFFYLPANKSLRYGLRAKLAGNDYHLGSGYTFPGMTNPVDNARYTRINAGPALEWNFWGPLILELTGGFLPTDYLILKIPAKISLNMMQKPGYSSALAYLSLLPSLKKLSTPYPETQ